jgi:SAM-dependent methyltransferase
MSTTVDVTELEAKVKEMYRLVATEPGGKYHFELGRQLAEHLGYPPDVLDRIPPEAIESFAGVGFFFDLAALREGENVIDLGSGSGMDVFFAASVVGERGHVVGVDFTAAQLAKARGLARAGGFSQVEFVDARIEALPVEDATFDCVISNGVINLAPDKSAVFAEVARCLRPGGRLALADILSEKQLTEAIVCDADLWASCIGGASQEDTFQEAIASAGLILDEIRENPYEFISQQAVNASRKYGVKSVSVLARKPR